MAASVALFPLCFAVADSIVNSSLTEVRSTRYLPFGSILATSGAADDAHKFTGQRLDAASGLYYYGARYYDPLAGRFITPDPLIQDPYDPQTLNRYAYSRNNPVKLLDPGGSAFLPAIPVLAWWALGGSAAAGGGAAYYLTGGDWAAVPQGGAAGLIAGGVALAAAPAGLPIAAGLGLGAYTVLAGGDLQQTLTSSLAAGLGVAGVANAGGAAGLVTSLARAVSERLTLGGERAIATSEISRSNADLVQRIANRAQAWGARRGLESGRVAGIHKHRYVHHFLKRYQAMFGDLGLDAESSWRAGDPQKFFARGGNCYEGLARKNSRERRRSPCLAGQRSSNRFES